jgi:hypothetical protein
MIRTVWLAIVCLAVVGALAAGRALRTSADPTIAELSADEPTVGIGHAQDTLSKSDRLEIKYVRHVISPQPDLPSIEPVTPVKPPMETRIISRHWRDPNAFSSKNSRQAKQSDSSKVSKNVDRKRDQAVDRSKSAEPVKPCRPGPFGDLLRSVNLSPACAS